MYSCDTCGAVYDKGKRVYPKGAYAVYAMLWTCPSCTEKKRIKRNTPKLTKYYKKS